MERKRLIMPKERSKIYFKNHYQRLPVPFVIYADFEAITEKIDTCQPSNGKSYTQTYQSHGACGFDYEVVCHYDQSYSKPVEIYRGEDSIETFIEKMFEEVRSRRIVMREHFNQPLKMTAENERDFRQSTLCHTCGRKFKVSDGNKPVRDHCHITGEYRGSAHDYCNLKLRIEPEAIKIPVIFHNLKGYDRHFIMQKIGKMIEDQHVYDVVRVKKDLNKSGTADNLTDGKKKKIDINIIAKKFENYMSFKLRRHPTLIDSFNFLSQSLDKLSSNLSEDSFIYTKEPLIREKGVYPYDYMDTFSRFDETSLPKRELFNSQLYDKDISEEEYKRSQKVWDAFRLKNLGEYHDLFLKSDVLLLTDVFQNFRETSPHHYKLDPCHYLFSPGLSWDAMLKKTKINLDLISDIDCSCLLKKD